MDGIINVYKEAGFTSHDVVAKLRGICRQKKIGHTGTLDPQATGVLPVCLGNATRACEMLTDRTKEYVAELLLGQITDTQDITGTVLEEREVTVSEAQVREVIAGFVGGYDQIPPMYSALKVNGKKLYELARAGKEVERQARHVDLPAIEILEIKFPVVKFRVECSKGTYIRSLCAVVKGYLGYEKNNNIKGVIFNNLSDRLYGNAARIVKDMGIEPLGYMPYKKNAVLESRHLGLVTSAEVEHFQEA